VRYALDLPGLRVTALVDALLELPFDLEDVYPDVPLAAWAPWRERHPETFWRPNRHRVVHTAFLVQRDDLTLLVDTGVGPAGTPMSDAVGALPPDGEATQRLNALGSELAAAGVAPEDVDMVVLTHLDVDHVGWALRFPRATYVVHRCDWDAFHAPGFDPGTPFPYLGEMVTPLAATGRLRLLDDEATRLVDGVGVRLMPGHSPGHLAVRLAAADGTVVGLLGDAFVHPAQILHPDWCGTMDRDPATTVATRRALLERIAAEDVIVAATHFPAPHFGRVDARVGWVPIALEARA
jgi:glyoxylase-like metal-dependent hydrolase (beta-lactamase superfamily II)